MLQTGFPMAICTLSAVLKQEGFDVDIFDTTFYKTEEMTSDEVRMNNLQVKPFDLGEKFKHLKSKEDMFHDLVSKVQGFSPGLIAISILEDLYPLSVDMFKWIERFDIPVIAGGVFPTFAPDVVMANKAVDMVCIGEGEETLIEVCQRLARDEDISDVRNLWVKKDGQIIKNGLRPPRDINLNPLPDFSIFDKKRFLKPMKGSLYKMAPVETHRGCPYLCSFCNSGSQKSLYKDETDTQFFRTREVGQIYKDLKMLVDEYNVEYVYFPADTILAGGKGYLTEFAKMYEKIGLPFYCQTRAETLNDFSVRCLKAMGCHSISIGIEHGNEDFREKVLNRKVSNQSIIDGVGLLKKTGIMVTVNNIVGFPEETRELAFDTINLNRDLDVYAHNAYYFTPYHGTPLRELCVERGYISEGQQTINITKDTVLDMPQFPLDEIRGLIRTFTLYVRLPQSRYKEIENAERFSEEGNAAFAKLQKEFWENFF